jgi:sarcosine oxidase delta subunit
MVKSEKGGDENLKRILFCNDNKINSNNKFMFVINNPKGTHL